MILYSLPTMDRIYSIISFYIDSLKHDTYYLAPATLLFLLQPGINLRQAVSLYEFNLTIELEHTHGITTITNPLHSITTTLKNQNSKYNLPVYP